ncbi:MAG: 50S ribosomal protein L4 [Rhodothermales bacterium]
MELNVLKQDGTDAGRTVALSESVFGIEPNDHVIWLDVRRIQANARQGTHKAKDRGEVAGSTRKLYRQKGTGYARAGSAKSPIRRTGGTIFGPRPRNYGMKINRKTRQLARRSALSYKAKGEAIRVVDGLTMDAPSTSGLQQLIAGFDASNKKVLLLTAGIESGLYRSARNLKKVTVLPAMEASTVDLMNAQVILIQEDAVSQLNDKLA